MATAMICDDKSIQLISKDNIKNEIEIPVEFVESEQRECVLCISGSNESFDIFTHITVLGTPLQNFISNFTNTELPMCENLPKYICKMCLDLINDLEMAKSEYMKLKTSFESIIRKNPLFLLSPAIEGVSQSSRGINKWALDGVVKIEPMAVDEALSHGDTERDTKMGFSGRVTHAEDGASASTSAEKRETQTQTENNSTSWPHEDRVDSATQTGGLRQYECTVCHRWFNTKGHLKTHSITHTGDKPFQCNVCQRRFSLKGNLRSHMRTHTGEKPYNCDICQRQFSELTNFRYHVRTHTGEKPYECDICHNRFNVKTHLKTHLRKHTGEKPHQCSICQRKYAEKRSLERHFKTHTNVES